MPPRPSRFATRLATLAFALAALPAAPRAEAPAPVRAVTWGFETWQCGDQWFEVRLGSGRDVVVDRIEGAVSGVAGSNADPARRWVRASLVTLTTAPPSPPVDGAVVETPPERSQQAVAGNLLSVVLKQRGDAFVHLPVSRSFLAPVRLPGGRLRALVDTQTYTGATAGDVRVPHEHPEECLDTEVQLTVQFHEG